MSPKLSPKKNEERSDRWVGALLELAKGRGDSEAVAARAVELSRALNIAPWIALATAERLITLKEAQLLDRVGRCKELQPAILDKRRPLADLKVMMPYAAHFLAVELCDANPGRKWDVRVVIRILEGVLGAEKKTDAEDLSFRVRNRSNHEYMADVERILAIMRRTRCDVGMAQDVEAGRITEPFAADYMRQKRALAIEERRVMEPREMRSVASRDHWPRS